MNNWAMNRFRYTGAMAVLGAALGIMGCAPPVAGDAIHDASSQAAGSGSSESPAAAEAADAMAIEGWAHGQADLMYSSGGPPVAIGKIAADGAIALDFPADVQPMQSLKLIFGCNGASTVSIDNPDARYEATPVALLVADFAKRKRYGFVVAAENEAVGAYKLNHDASPTVPGAYYQWFYLPEEAAVSGHCSSTLEVDSETTRPVKSTFDLDFHPGWNLVETRIVDVVTAGTGHTFSTDTEFRTLPSLPAGTVWTFVADPAG